MIAAIAMIVMVVSMCWLGFLDNGKGVLLSIAPFAIFAVANVFVSAALWPSIPYVVPAEMLGVAYGVMLSTLNLCIAFGPIILGLIHDATERYDHGYAWSLAFIVVWLVVGVYDALLLTKYDAENNYKLFIPEAVNKAYVSSP